jgi:HEAT repeat protein
MEKLSNTVLSGLFLFIYGCINIFISLFINLFSKLPQPTAEEFFYSFGLFFLIIGLIVFSVGLVRFIIDIISLKKQNFVEIVRALGNIGKDSEMTAATLQEALNDSDKHVRREAALALSKIGSCATITVPSLINALYDKNPDVRWRASDTLGSLGIKTEEVVSNLNNLIHDECDYVCESAITALDKLSEE